MGFLPFFQQIVILGLSYFKRRKGERDELSHTNSTICCGKFEFKKNFLKGKKTWYVGMKKSVEVAAMEQLLKQILNELQAVRKDINEEEANVVKRIYDWYNIGWGFKKITNELNRLGKE